MAALLAGAAASATGAARSAQRDCLGTSVRVEGESRASDSSFELVARAGGTSFHRPASIPARWLDRGERVVRLGEVEVHAEEIRDTAHDVVIGHRILYLRDRADCSEGTIAAPFHEHMEPPYELLRDRARGIQRVASVDPRAPTIDFRRIPRVPPTWFARSLRASWPLVLAAGAALWMTAIWRRLARSDLQAQRLLLWSAALGAVSAIAAAHGWSAGLLP